MKQFDTRIQYKYDTYENWVNNGHNIHSLAGEMYVYKMPDESTRIKFGDGNTPVSDLPYANLGTLHDQNKAIIALVSPEYVNYDESKKDEQQQQLSCVMYVDPINYSGALISLSSKNYATKPPEKTGDENQSIIVKDYKKQTGSINYCRTGLRGATIIYATVFLYKEDDTYDVETAEVTTGKVIISEDEGWALKNDLDKTTEGTSTHYDSTTWELYNSRGKNLFTYKGYAGQDVGNYATSVTLKYSEYVWSDKSTDAKTIYWKIRDGNEYGRLLSFYTYDEGIIGEQLEPYSGNTATSPYYYYVPDVGNRTYLIKTLLPTPSLDYKIEIEYYTSEDNFTTSCYDDTLETITITFGKNAPKSVTITIPTTDNFSGWTYVLSTTNMLDLLSWEKLSEIAKQGKAKEEGLQVGQVKSVKLVGSIHDSFNNLIEFDESENLTVRLVHIEELTDSQGTRYDKLYFQCFTDLYNKDVCIDGVFESYVDPTALETSDPYGLTAILELLRDNEELLNVIAPTTQSYATAYVEGNTLHAESVSITSKLHIPTQYQVENIFEYSSSAEVQRIRYAHDHINDAGQCWWITNDLYYDETKGSLGSGAYDVEGKFSDTITGRSLEISKFGLSPIFVIGEPPKS